MATFKTHFWGGSGWAALFSSTAFLFKLLTLPQALVVFGTGLGGALLPDVDSQSSLPRAWFSRLMGVGIPVWFYPQIAFRWEQQPLYLIGHLVGYLVVGYVLIGLLVRLLLSKLTVHRGVLHSLPFALLVSQVTYLLMFSRMSADMALLAAGAAGGGVLVHLILDEWHAVRFKYKLIPVFKRSRGSALKILGSSSSGNVLLLLLLSITSLLCGFLYRDGNLDRLYTQFVLALEWLM